VDDILLAAVDQSVIDEMVRVLDTKFKVRVMGEPKYFLGMNVSYTRDRGEVMLSQFTYIQAVMERFGDSTLFSKGLPMLPDIILNAEQSETDPTDCPYSSLVGALLFVAVSTRPDIAYAVNKLTKFIRKPARQHWDAARQVLAFLNKTKFKGIRLG
jgi:hypothetical protein